MWVPPLSVLFAHAEDAEAWVRDSDLGMPLERARYRELEDP